MTTEIAETQCQACGAPTPAGARFCPSCGARLQEHSALRREDGGEHRQITVMFCDLVGSTQLSTRLDSEDLREVLRTYQKLCAEAIERRDGMIAQYLGDGIVAYFGYPRAHEDAAIRAVDAALEIVSRVEETGIRMHDEHAIDFATRVSLHTGRVLIGEMGAGTTREHHAVTGAVPNIAARLESLAERNGVVLSAHTRSLVANAFDTQSIGFQDLKGVPEPLEVFSVQGRANATTVLPVRAGRLVGRDSELATLGQAWTEATAGLSNRVVITSDPGAGKSVLAAAFLHETAVPRRQVFEFAGSAAEQHAPYACLINTIDRWLRDGEMPQNGAVLAKIESWFTAPDRDHAETLYRLWDRRRESLDDLRRDVTRACLALLRARTSPVVLVIEDAHWVDPSTLDILDQLAVSPDIATMALVLTRPGLDMTWSDAPKRDIFLSGLTPEASVRLIEATVGGTVEPATTRQIIDATNGLPLYVEEFTKALIDSGQIRLQRGVFRATSLGAAMQTPESLLDLITARLDTLGEAKLLAQISAVLGRAFDRNALLDVSGFAAEVVDASIASLTMAGILSIARGGRLSFRHALYQTAAYESQVSRARKIWHQRYLAWIERNPDRLDAARPDVLGHHMEACGRIAEAAQQYLEAGLSANRASASREAAAHFRKSRDLMDQGTRSDPALRLRVQVLLAGALLSARGPGSAETRAAYDSAVEMAARVEESEWHFPAYWGWWRVSDSFATMARRAHRLLDVSERMEGQEFKLQAQHCVWANAFQTGDLEESVFSARKGLALYREGGFDDLSTLYGGHDCKVCAHGEIALASWLQGAGDAAVPDVEIAIAHAEKLDHLGSLMHALDIAVMLHHYRADGAAVAGLAQRLLSLGNEHDLEDYRAKGEIFRGWSRLAAGATADGLDAIEHGFRVMQEVGTPEDFPVYQCMRAEALRTLGDPDGAMRVLAEGRTIIDAEGVNYWGAEIARQEAETEMTRAAPSVPLIMARLREAESIAALQGATMLELRAGLTGLVCARREGDDRAALARLTEILSRIEDHATSREISAARAAVAPPR